MDLDYNNVILKEMKDYLDWLMPRITLKDELNRSITIDRFEVQADDNSDISYYLQNGSTYCFNVTYYYTVSGMKMVNGMPVPYSESDSFDLQIPKKLGSVFVINGKQRISTFVLTNSQECRIYLESDKKGYYIKLHFDYTRWASIRHDDKANTDSILFTLKVDEDINEGGQINFEGTEDNFNTYHEYLLLNEEQKNKLKIKLDTDDIPDYIDLDLCLRMAQAGPDRTDDLIIDKKINTIDKNLMTTLYSNKFGARGRNVKTFMGNEFYKSGKLRSTKLQTEIFSFFRNLDDSSLDVPKNINPMSYDSLTGKIVFPLSVSYNKTMTDIIDVVNSPANNSMNRLNEFNVCTEFRDGKIFIKCYKFPTFEPVSVEYLTYLTVPVLANSECDYKHKSIPAKDQYRIKHRLKEKMVEKLDGIKYIEPQRDEKLSVTSRQVPMINVSDGTRDSMGIRMLTQAEELENGEEALICSGNEDYSYMSDIYHGKNAEVIDITDEAIIIKDSDGSTYPIAIRKIIKGEHELIISFQVMVKVGQKIKAGDVLVTPTVTKNKGYSLGINARVGYMFYKGYNYEDAVIVSESFSKKMACYKIIDVTTCIRPEDWVTYLKPIGSSVKIGDILIGKKDKYRVDKKTEESLANFPITAYMDLQYKDANVMVPNNVLQGYVLDIKIQKNAKLSATISDTVKCINKFIRNDGDRIVNPEIPERYLRMKLDEVELDRRSIYTITYRILKYSPLNVGNKITNRWGGKGEVSLILPDDKMPYERETKRPLEVILNPSSVIKRKNPPQIYESALTKCIDRIYYQVSVFVEKGQLDKARKFLRTYYDDEFDNMSDREFLSTFQTKGRTMFKMKVGSYFSLGVNTVLKWCKDLGVSELTYVDDPELGPIENPINVGDIYMIRLYHAAEYDGKVTTEILDNKNRQPYMGKGWYRGKTDKDGQSVGEMETWVLMARGVTEFLEEHRNDQLQRHYDFLTAMLVAGYTVSDDKGLPYLSPYRDKVLKINASKEQKQLEK